MWIFNWFDLIWMVCSIDESVSTRSNVVWRWIGIRFDLVIWSVWLTKFSTFKGRLTIFVWRKRKDQSNIKMNCSSIKKRNRTLDNLFQFVRWIVVNVVEIVFILLRNQNVLFKMTMRRKRPNRVNWWWFNKIKRFTYQLFESLDEEREILGILSKSLKCLEIDDLL